MRITAGWMYVLGALIGIGAAISGVLLMTHTTRDCAAYYCASSHPFFAVGLASLIGGLAYMAVVLVVGALCTALADVRDLLAVTVEIDDEPVPAPYVPSSEPPPGPFS